MDHSFIDLPQEKAYLLQEQCAGVVQSLKDIAENLEERKSLESGLKNQISDLHTER